MSRPQFSVLAALFIVAMVVGGLGLRPRASQAQRIPGVAKNRRVGFSLPGSRADGGTDLAASAQAAPASEDGPMAGRVSPCRSAVTSTVSASNIRVCDTVSVTVTVQTQCPVCSSGFNVVFVQLGESEHPEWRIDESLDALGVLERLADTIILRGSAVRVGVVHYSYTGSHAVPKIVLPLTEKLKRAAGPIRENAGDQQLHNGPTSAAARAAVNMILAARRDQPSDAGDDEDLLGCNAIILFTSQRKNPEDQRRAASMVLTTEISLFVGCPSGTSRWCEVPRDLPKTSSYYSEYNERGKIAKNLEADIETVFNNARVRDVSLTQQLPAGLAYIDGSANVPPTTITTDTTTGATTLAWDWPRIGAATPPTITYRAKPAAEGLWQIGGSSKVVDVQNHSRELPLPSQAITVSGLCPPTGTPPPTPIAPPTPTSSATPVPSVTPTPLSPPSVTLTSPPTATATREPAPIYMPILLKESCNEQWVYSDVVLVMDMSLSMNQSVGGGRTKLSAALDAGRRFVALMDFEPDAAGRSDRVAVVGFNAEAWVAAGLTNDAVSLGGAIDSLPTRQARYTRLDLGFDAGLDVLRPALGTTNTTPVIVLLTDGLPDQVPPDPSDGTVETTVRKAAQRAKDSGVRVYTIGLGLPIDLNAPLLRDCATSPAAYFQTPDPETLATIYTQIAYSFGCPKDRHDWGTGNGNFNRPAATTQSLAKGMARIRPEHLQRPVDAARYYRIVGTARRTDSWSPDGRWPHPLAKIGPLNE